MEVNSNPSLNIFLEREVPNSGDGVQTEKILQELDKHVKAKVVTEAIRLVSGEGDGEYEGAFEQLLPCEEEDMSEYYVWNKAQQYFDLLLHTTASKKDPEAYGRISMFQFLRLAKV